MKGDIAFAGFVLTAEEWQELDAQQRAQLISVVTRRGEPGLAMPRPARLAEGTGRHEALDVIELEPDPDVDVDSAAEPTPAPELPPVPEYEYF